MKKLPIPESYWVEDDLFLAGEHPSGYNSEETRRKMDTFLECGIRSFIDLTQPHELIPYEPILKEEAKIYDVEVRYQRLSIYDHGVPTKETMALILDAIDESIQNGEPVYVHCWGGVGRTGTVVGCYLVRHGMSGEQALRQVDALYKTRGPSYFLPTSPETQEQFDFVRQWKEIPTAGRRSGSRYCEG